MKVLVIDDEPQIRRALKVSLERNNHEAILAASGEEGLDLAAVHNPDLIILDLAMPGIDGFEVCKQLRTWTKHPSSCYRFAKAKTTKYTRSILVPMIT